MSNKRFLRILTVFICMISLGLGTGYYFAGYYQQETKPDIQGLLWPEPKQLKEFKTIDQSGKDFGIDRLRGKWSFIFFGYTHCPDVCPATLAVMNGLNSRLQSMGRSEDLQYIFVTVDPERDTVQRLNEYLGYFNPDFIGLGGSIEQIQSLSGQIGIVYMYGDKSPETGNYLVDHTASIFLADPDGRLVAIFSAPHQVESIMERFIPIREFIEDSL